MDQNTQVRELWRDALSGKISRRELMVRGAQVGLSATVLAALGQEGIRSALADRQMIWTLYQWQFDLHPTLTKVLQDGGVKVEIGPTSGFSFDVFVNEAKNKASTWDAYTGVTPFLEMISLAETGTIEPWDPYLPAGALDDLLPATRAEGTYQASTDTKPGLYVWPFLLDVIVQGWHHGVVAKAGLDPEKAPATWTSLSPTLRR